VQRGCGGLGGGGSWANLVGFPTVMKVLALDYGSARTGIAVSDPTGTLARPVGIAERVGTPAGLERLLQTIRDEAPERVVVGLPLTLRGEQGEQARETLAFVETLRGAVTVPVETYDERFTSSLAGGDDARAAAYLLTTYLEWLGRAS
jgi:putative transcription antitermination factor YqgF